MMISIINHSFPTTPLTSPTNYSNMNISNTFPLFLFFFIIFTKAANSASYPNCLSSFCRHNEPSIRFPFRLDTHQPRSCGYPGFDLSCDAFNQTLIDLPNSGKFTVQSIDYTTQSIRLNDQDNCLARRLLHLNLSGSPFRGYFSQQFLVFNCSTFDYSIYNLQPIRCLSGDGYYVFASSPERVVDYLQSTCWLVATVEVPVQWSYYEPVLSSQLSNDIRLTWLWPRCRRCESRGGQCGLEIGGSTQVVCKDVSHRGLTKSARIALIVCGGLPALLCLTGFMCFLGGLAKNYSRRRSHPMLDFSAMGAPRPITTVSGLDKLTIESYPKTILGESCRLPMPDYDICSICLSEYVPNEALRTIPDCQHCFHAECIDEWLTRNGSCPVCRKSPMSSPIEQPL